MSPETVGLVPPGVVTVTSTAPDPAGTTALICAELTTENDVAGVAPKLTPVAPVKLLPTTAIVFPPAAGPLDPLSEFTVGAGAAQIAIEPITPPPVLAASTLHEVLLMTNPAPGTWTTGASTDVLGGPGANTPPPITRLPLGQAADTTPAVELWLSCSL
jgi:hypothetical protein